MTDRKYASKVPVNVRFATDEHDLLVRAAEKSGTRTPTEFVRNAALAEAERVTRRAR